MRTDEQRAKHAEYMRQWRADNPERAREIVQRWRENNPDKLREIRKQYFKKNREYYRQHNSQYKKEYPEKCGKYRDDWDSRNPEKHKAHHLVTNMVYTEKIKKPSTCSLCHIVCRTQAHHDDYSKPKDFVWLCDACHRLKHKNDSI